jgi:iron-sulfur cluster assembly protein
VELTNKAREKLLHFLEERSSSGGVLVTVKPTGCSGYAYHLEYADNQEGIIQVDSKYSHLFEGVVLDYVKKGLNEGFEFDNPNEKAKCGCGESFTV